MTHWLNDQPLEHTGPNGTNFKADRSDLRNGVTVTWPSWPLTEAQKHMDFMHFGSWHSLCIFKQLNGFSGYDSIEFTEANAQEPVPPALSDNPEQFGREARILDILADYGDVPRSEVKPSVPMGALGLDSLDQIEAVLAVEGEFDIEMPDDELSQIRTVQDLFDLVRKHHENK